MWPSILVATAAALVAASPLERRASSPPTVTVKNGTYAGVHSDAYQQDFFLGVPFAQPPVGDLRFANPRALNASWAGSRSADRYSAACVGYGPSQLGYNTSEDCLYLNVIRPAEACSAKPLPVLVWIYGGGWVQGSGVDLRYNMSVVVQRAAALGQPVVAVTLNYRLSAWGWLQSNETAAAGSSNMGLRDQRLALTWIKENIGAFGGDPARVTIWGQSAGAASVGQHLLAFNGRDDGLFRGAIMDSGGPVFLSGGADVSLQPKYNQLVNATGCNATVDTLQCLRRLPYAQLNAALNTTALSGAWGPKTDGDIIARSSVAQLAQGAFVKVPVILGANTDEGTSFAPMGINTTDQFLASLLASTTPPMPRAFADQLLAAYPVNSSSNILQNLGGPDAAPPAYPYGAQYRRVATYYGDKTIVAGRRLACATWAAAGLPAYCFRFNAIPAWAGPYDGATHFVELAFAQLDLPGVGYPPVRKPPFEGLGNEYRDLARLMASDYIAFVNGGDPNGWAGRSAAAVTKGVAVPAWPRYSVSGASCGVPPMNFLYDANVTSSVEPDTFRQAQIDLVNSGNAAVYGR